MSTEFANTQYPAEPDALTGQVLSIDPTNAPLADRDEHVTPHRRSLFHFIAELRRRRVCRAATLYSVVFWLTCQIIELVISPMGLPDWTLKLIIVLGLVAFPLVLFLSWLVEITPNGLVIDNGETAHPIDVTDRKLRAVWNQILDCTLLFAALTIAAQLAAGLLSSDSVAAQTHSQRIVIEPFRAASRNDASIFSQGLTIELQHALSGRSGFVAISSVPVKPNMPAKPIAEALSLTGSIAINEERIRITAILTNTATGEISWSKVFLQPRTKSLDASADIAEQIVGALPTLSVVSANSANLHAT